MSATPENMTEYDHFAAAKGYEATGELDNAMKAYDAAIELSPTFTKAWYYKALLHYKKKEFEQATTCAKKVMELKPGWEKHVKKYMPDLVLQRLYSRRRVRKQEYKDSLIEGQYLSVDPFHDHVNIFF